MLDRLAAFIESHQRFLLTTHENPDGDGIGAMVGLYGFLQAKGKEARIVVSPLVPEALQFVDPQGVMEVYDPADRHQALAAWPDAWLLVDASEPHRLGRMHPAFQAFGGTRACLDHHLKDQPRGFDHEFVDSAASASAQLVLRLALRHLPRPLPPLMARALYTGLVDDTGNFRFSNTSPEVLRFAADLVEDGVEPARIYQSLYQQGRLARLRIQGRAMERLELLAEGRYGRLVVTQDDMRACGAEHEDLEALVNRPLEIRNVQISVLLEELPDGRVKASLRSREIVNVNAVARHFGGGGHFLASGTKLDGPMPSAIAAMDAVVLSQIANDLP